MTRATLAIVIGLCGAQLGCDDGAGTPVDAPPAIDAVDAATGPDAEETNALVISGMGVTGAVGLTIVVDVHGPPAGSIVGRFCVPVTASPMAFREIVRVWDGISECSVGAPAVLPAGDYNAVGMAVDGTGSLQACAFLPSFARPGPTELMLPAFSQCPGG